ncbi:hypothetical protein [Burkholderia sp. PU8-34]
MVTVRAEPDKRAPEYGCGFNWSMQRIDEIAQQMYRSVESAVYCDDSG